MGLLDWFKAKPPEWPAVEFAEIQKRSRILVVDDSEFPYLDLLKRDGYTVTKWDDVADLRKLETGYFDLVLLDIQGVGTEISQDQGLGVLRHVKRIARAQIVIAYSNADWALKYKEFFDLADATLDKRDDYVDFKRVIDELLRKRFSLEFYVERISDLVKPTGRLSADTIATARKAILTRNPDALAERLKTQGIDASRIGLAVQVVQAGIAILNILVAS